LRFALAVLPILWLVRVVHWRDVGARAAQVGARGIALSALAAFGSLCVGALRWRVMLGTYGADPAKVPGVFTLLRHNVVGQYFSVLPTGIAGEFVRGFRVQHCLPRASTSYVLLFVERIAGLLGLVLVAGLGAIYSPSGRSDVLARTMNVGVVLAIGLVALMFVLPQLRSRSASVARFIQRLPIVGRPLSAIPAPNGILGPIAAVFLSIASQLCVVGTAAALIAPLAPQATLGVCARVVPAIILVTYIPVTPGALGQREIAFVQFFGREGVDPAAAVAASILMFSVMLLLSLVGGIVLALERAWGVSTSPPPQSSS